MNKITSIHLNGKAFQIEDGAHDVLRAYLDQAGRTLEHNPDRKEIIADLEQAIADKIAVFLHGHKDVLTQEEIERVLSDMGPVHGTDDGPSQDQDVPGGKAEPVKRLYLIRENSVIAGVCTGIAAYFNIDPTVVRVIFIILTIITGGAWIFVYIALMFLVPYATTSEEFAAARGVPFNAQEVINCAKSNYAQFANRAEWRRRKREWRENARSWRQACRAEMRTNRMPFIGILSAFIALVWVFTLLSLLSTGAIFGWTVTNVVPLWLAVIILFLVFRAVMKPVRRAAYESYYDRPVHGVVHGGLSALADLVVLVAFVYAAWFVYTHYPDVRVFVDGILINIKSALTAPTT